MHAITVSEYGADPAVTELPRPRPGPGQVLIAVQGTRAPLGRVRGRTSDSCRGMVQVPWSQCGFVPYPDAAKMASSSSRVCGSPRTSPIHAAESAR